MISGRECVIGIIIIFCGGGGGWSIVAVGNSIGIGVDVDVGIGGHGGLPARIYRYLRLGDKGLLPQTSTKSRGVA